MSTIIFAIVFITIIESIEKSFKNPTEEELE